MAANRSLLGLLSLLLLVGTIASGAVFYAFVLPKLATPVEAPAAPSAAEPPFSLEPARKTSTLRVPPLPGTFDVRIALEASNAHQAWTFANMGSVTDPASLFARHGVTAYLVPLEEAT